MSQLSSHSILIPVFNGERHIAETLRSVLSQSVRCQAIVVSDNASTDQTREIVEAFEGDGCVRLVRQVENLGMVGNWNALLDLVDTETFTLISHDDRFSDAQALQHALEILAADPTAAAVFSNISFIDAAGRHFMTNRFRRPPIFDGKETALASILTCRNLFGWPLAIRTHAAEGLRYDPRVCYAADLDYAVRLAARGGSLHHIAAPLFEYRVHLESATRRAQAQSNADFDIIAEHAGIQLSLGQRLRHRVNLWLTPLKRLGLLRIMAFRQKVYG